MYEVEIKVELTAAQRETLLREFKDRGFASKTPTPQNDYYVYLQKPSFGMGKYNTKRYRNEAGKFLYTEKVWELIDGDPHVMEKEIEVSKEDFEKAIAQFPDALKIIKTREWFDGSHAETPISITIDSVKFDHSPAMRFFIEAEIPVEKREDAPKAKDLIKNFLKDILRTEEIKASPGMVSMAIDKL